MILDKPRNIGQRDSENAGKMMIRKLAPVAQWIERSPPKLTAERWQATARAQNQARPSSNKPWVSCAEHLCFARPLVRILDSY